jgi:hypothetical protein
MTRPQIDLMIVGAQKAGTTSLLEYIGQHPDVCAAAHPELAYFVDDLEWSRGWDAAYDFYFGKCGPSTVRVGKLAGLMYQPQAVERLKEHNREVVVAALLRNPVDRAWSAFLYARRRGYEELATLEAALDASPNRHADDRLRQGFCAYVERGTYAPAIQRLQNAFGVGSVHVFLTDDLKRSPADVCQSLFKSVGVVDDFVPTDLERRNVAGRSRAPALSQLATRRGAVRSASRRLLPKTARDRIRSMVRHVLEEDTPPPVMADALRARLVDTFRAPNAELAALLGRELPWDA